MNSIKRLNQSGLLWIWISMVVIAIDRYSKIWVADHLLFQEPLRVLPFFNLTLAYNTGAAFSFLNAASGWQNWFLGSLAFIISVVVIVWLSRLSKRMYWMSIALTLILGGALGNAWDRILYGHVIDFISLHWQNWYFAIFNIADSAICIGAVMIMVQWLREMKG